MGPRVLIVEDEEPLTLLLRYNLEAEGYAVDSVARGDEAEIRLREEVPDIVLLDWMLPGLSGIELCRRIRVRPETERLPVIMLTMLLRTIWTWDKFDIIYQLTGGGPLQATTTMSIYV